MLEKVELGQFMGWLQERLMGKYGGQLAALHEQLSEFARLVEQLQWLYGEVGEEEPAQKSLMLLQRIATPLPTLLNLSFCQQHLHNFKANVALLCAYYHALTHSTHPFDKQRIVKGINRLHQLSLAIKARLAPTTQEHAVLTLLSEYKALFQTRIQTLLQEEQNSPTFQAEAARFYAQVKNEEGEPRKALLSAFFQLHYQAVSVQAHLEVILDGPARLCEQLRGKKKHFALNEACFAFARGSSTLLRSNLAIKHLKKLKGEQFVRAIETLAKEHPHHCDPAEVQHMIGLLLEVLKEIDKIEQAGVLSALADYREQHTPANLKQFIAALLLQKQHLARRHTRHDHFKHFLRLAQLTALQQFHLRIDII